MPPLVKLPIAPENLTVARRGDTVDLQFTVPSTNTDGSRPANVAHAEIYAITAPQEVVAPLTDQQLMKVATKVGSVPVKAPRDPNQTADADDPSYEVDAPEGPGLDQGAVGRVQESLTDRALAPVIIPKERGAADSAREADDQGQPLLGPPPIGVSRIYAAVSTSARGRKGPLSQRIVMPLVPPPAAPTAIRMTYDESSITVTWPTVRDLPAPAATAPTTPEVLPSRAIGTALPPITYNVYDVTNADAPTKLTAAPIAEPRFADNRMVWGAKRCYTVRTAQTVGSFTTESDAPAPECGVLTDTFAPAAPKGVAGIASEGAISLIWEPNAEKDLAGYIVLRAKGNSDNLQPLTPQPIAETSFKDAVASGVQYTYVVKAVDRAGNASVASAVVTETAR